MALILVAAFVVFSEFNHQPALALSVFSYLAGNIASFIVTTLLVLAIIFIFYLATRVLRL